MPKHGGAATRMEADLATSLCLEGSSCLLIELDHPFPEAVTGLQGLTFRLSAYASSVMANP